MYLLSSVFKDPEMAFISYVSINLLISINTIISTSIVYFLGELNKNNEVSVLARQRLDKIAALSRSQFEVCNLQLLGESWMLVVMICCSYQRTMALKENDTDPLFFTLFTRTSSRSTAP